MRTGQGLHLSTVEESIADFIMTGEFQERDRETALSLVKDTCAIMLAGRLTAVAGLMGKYAGMFSGDSPLLVGGTSSLNEAVKANAVTGYCLDMDALYDPATLHIAASLVPLLLTLSSHCTITGSRFIRALNIGYGVSAAFGRALSSSSMYSRYLHPSSICNTFGCAAATSFILGLNRREVINAMGLASTMACGLTSVFDESEHQSAPLQIARAASSGLEAALLSSRGMNGPSLFGPKSVMIAFAGEERRGKERMIAEELASSGWFGLTAFKRHSACRFLQSAIDAALALREEGIRLADVESCTVELAPETVHLVDNAGDRTHNAQLVLSLAFHLGHVYYEDYMLPEAGGLQSRGMRIFTVKGGSQFTGLYPEAVPCRLTLKCRDGTRTERTVMYARGDMRNPMSGEEIIQKAYELNRPERERVQSLFSLCEGIAGMEDISAVLHALTAV